MIAVVLLLLASLSGVAAQCNVNGTLNATGGCACRPGWVGTLCQFECPRPGNGQPCAGRGNCVVGVVNGSAAAVCSCTYPGAVGNCETGCDAAILSGAVNGTLCSGHGTCGGPGNRICNCTGRFAGPTCSDCIAGWVGGACHLPCPGPAGPNGTFDGCFASLGRGSCVAGSNAGQCVCGPNSSGPDCRRGVGQVGILDPPSTQSGRWLKFDPPTTVAGGLFTLRLSGFRSFPVAPSRVRISESFGNCWGAGSEAAVDPVTKTALLTAPSVPGVYSICALWRTDFDVITVSEGVPQRLTVQARIPTVVLNGYENCQEYLKGINRTDLCGCFITGPASDRARVPNNFNVAGILASPSPPSIFSGCCTPTGPRSAQGNTTQQLPWGFCATGQPLSAWA